MKLAIVGSNDATHIGGSLQRAALASGHTVFFHDTEPAFATGRLRRSISWRWLRRPPLLERFSAHLSAAVRAQRPDLLIVTGLAPITAEALDGIRAAGVRCVNYLTDDPWNRSFRADWLLRAMAAYDHVFTPRRANLQDLARLGCAVSYLPFGYDADLFQPAPAHPIRFDVFFAGHADADRYALLAPLVASGASVALYGRDWERDARFAGIARGQLEPARFAQEVAACAVALCPVRRANRDGHAMRTFELAAVRACILAEDTAEHRDIFGDTVAWFADAAELPGKVRALIDDPQLRARLAHDAHQRITQGGNTYGDRLNAILAQAF